MALYILIIVFLLSVLILYLTIWKSANYLLAQNTKDINAILQSLKQKYKLKKRKNILTGKVKNVPITIKTDLDKLSFEITVPHYLNKTETKNNYSLLANAVNIEEMLLNALWSIQLSSQTKYLKHNVDSRIINFTFNNKSIQLIKKFEFKIDRQKLGKTRTEEISNTLKTIIEEIVLISLDTRKNPDIKKRLTENINNSLDNNSRISNLKSLIEHFSADKDIDIVLTNLLNDNSPAIQIFAAQNLNDLKKSTDCLLTLLATNKNLTIKEIFSIIDFINKNRIMEAVGILKKLVFQTSDQGLHREIISTLIFFDTDKIYYFLLELLESSRHLHMNEKLMIIKAIRRKKYTKAIPALINFFKHEINYQIKNEILNTFTTMQDSSVNDFLMQLLKGNDSPQIELQNAIAACGDISLVEPLYILSEKTFNPVLKDQLKHVIAEIQSRLGGAEKGWVSISETVPEQGGISKIKEIQNGAISKAQIRSKKNKTRN